MSEKKKVTEEMLDEAARKLAGRLDAMLASLPEDHPNHFASKDTLPNREKKAIYAEDRPSVEPCRHDGAGEGDWCYQCWTNIKKAGA